MNPTASPLVIYAESTPNPNAMMFVANQNFVDSAVILEFEQKENTSSSPLAAELFKFPFITGVFITRNVITLTKGDESVNWNGLVLEMREFIKDFINNNGVIYTGEPISRSENPEGSQTETDSEARHKEPATETEKKIIDILEEYVRPAVEGDGGAIHFAGFSEDGVVTVKLRGACSGCPSSTITLKSGIEALLKRMIPEVKEVVAESV